MNHKKNRILAVFFIAFFAANVVLPSIILLHFKVNQEYISNNLCVEKDFEESSCAGHCQLKKSLEVIEKGSSNKEDVNFNIESHISYLFASTPDSYLISSPVEKKTFSSLENKNPLSGFYETPFLPPILL